MDLKYRDDILSFDTEIYKYTNGNHHTQFSDEKYKKKVNLDVPVILKFNGKTMEVIGNIDKNHNMNFEFRSSNKFHPDYNISNIKYKIVLEDGRESEELPRGIISESQIVKAIEDIKEVVIDGNIRKEQLDIECWESLGYGNYNYSELNPENVVYKNKENQQGIHEISEVASISDRRLENINEFVKAANEDIKEASKDAKVEKEGISMDDK